MKALFVVLVLQISVWPLAHLSFVKNQYQLLPVSCPLGYDWGRCTSSLQIMYVNISCADPGYRVCCHNHDTGDKVWYNLPQWKHYMYCTCDGFEACPRCQIEYIGSWMCPDSLYLYDITTDLVPECKWVYLPPDSEGMQYPIRLDESNKTCTLDVVEPECQFPTIDNGASGICSFWQ